jgi:hypothetical protein
MSCPILLDWRTLWYLQIRLDKRERERNYKFPCACFDCECVSLCVCVCVCVSLSLCRWVVRLVYYYSAARWKFSGIICSLFLFQARKWPSFFEHAEDASFVDLQMFTVKLLARPLQMTTWYRSAWDSLTGCIYLLAYREEKCQREKIQKKKKIRRWIDGGWETLLNGDDPLFDNLVILGSPDIFLPSFLPPFIFFFFPLIYFSY